MLLEKTPPQDIEAERAVLGALLLSKDALERAAERLHPEDFYKLGHQVIYQAMQDLFRAHELRYLVCRLLLEKKKDYTDSESMPLHVV